MLSLFLKSLSFPGNLKDHAENGNLDACYVNSRCAFPGNISGLFFYFYCQLEAFNVHDSSRMLWLTINSPNSFAPMIRWHIFLNHIACPRPRSRDPLSRNSCAFQLIPPSRIPNPGRVTCLFQPPIPCLWSMFLVPGCPEEQSNGANKQARKRCKAWLCYLQCYRFHHR